MEIFKNKDISIMLKGQCGNHRKKYFKVDEITFGFVKIKPKEDYLLLFHVGRVIKDLNILNGMGYEYLCLGKLG